MVVRNIAVLPGDGLIIDKETLVKAGLGRRLQLVIQRGEIRILPKAETLSKAEQVLENLAGCLGQETAADYDFSLKVGGLYEAR